ncbi:MAG: NAD(P)/FAD-dependent oxidoreductase [Pseudomonadota bacterium]
MRYDVIIIGGSYGGIAAALQLVRARRAVLVIDAGAPRNRFAAHSHGYLGQDRVPPGEISALARRELGAYPTLTWIEGEAVAMDGAREAFQISLRDGQTVEGRRVLFATGSRDPLPEIPGLKDRWGISVFHCPYCHGYELSDRRIGVIGTEPMSVHQAELLADWGDVTFFPNETITVDRDAHDALKARNVAIVEGAIARITGIADIALENGQTLAFDGLFIITATVQASSIPADIGAALQETPLGTIIETSETNETSVQGVYACGDAATMPQFVSSAVGDGAMAGVHIHHSLVWPDT